MNKLGLLARIGSLVLSVGCGEVVTDAVDHEAASTNSSVVSSSSSSRASGAGGSGDGGGDVGGSGAGGEAPGVDPDVDACPTCTIQCTSLPAETDEHVVRVYVTVAPSEGADVATVRAVKGPLHAERGGLPDPMPRMELFSAQGNYVETPFGDDGATPMSFEIDSETFSMGASLTFSYVELQGTLFAPPSPDLPAEVPLVCWSPAAKQAVYDPSTGACVGGGTPYTAAYVRETKRGQCSMPFEDLDEGDYGTPTLRGWDLRGARLTTGLHFADLLDADLRGADLTELDYGYARITGTVDAHTKLPALGGCTITGDRVECLR